MEVFVSSIETNQSSDLKDTKYLHNLISDLQNVLKSKDQIINLLRKDMKNLQEQLNVNESNAWKSVSGISHKNYIHKTQAENSNRGIKFFNRLIPLARDIHTPSKVIQQKMTSKISLKTVLPTTQIIHRRRRDQINRGN